MPNPITTDNGIMEHQLPLAQLITNLHYLQHPELETRYGKPGREKCTQDAVFHLSYLSEAIRAESTEIFTAYLEWAQVMLQTRKIPVQDLMDNLDCMENACQQLLPAADYQKITPYIKNGIQRLKILRPLPASCLTESNPLLPVAKEYLSLLLKANRNQAKSLILELVKNNYPVADIYEHIFQATQYEVGLLWQTNKITVAHEHYCTAATQLIMASLYPYIFDTEKKGAKMLACTVSGDLHEIGIRMVSDFFEMDGWDTYYMGSNMPDTSIISAAKEQQADILAISVTMPFHIHKAESLIKKIRSDEEIASLKIIVGGYPFSLVPDLWSRIGADGAAGNAKQAIKLANQMILLN
ncbi:MAG: cobalamin B12-binding domain-containing protein [Ferruginibacter sp.]|nr:cobalamin B12-binding domain-containing protein [Ferruginibacter sp.]